MNKIEVPAPLPEDFVKEFMKLSNDKKIAVFDLMTDIYKKEQREGFLKSLNKKCPDSSGGNYGKRI